jgi:hypothetical protein
MTSHAPAPAPTPAPEPADPEPLEHRPIDPEKRGMPSPPTPPEHEHPKQP